MSICKVGLIKLGNSNIEGVRRILIESDYEVDVIDGKHKLDTYSHLIIPGVGSFDFGVKAIAEFGLDDEIRQFANSNKPILGICLGMQLLGKSSEEGKLFGLNLLDINFVTLKKVSPIVPHVGFNSIMTNSNHNYLKDINGSYFYFNHSYAISECSNLKDLAYTDFGFRFISAVCKNNIFGVQFHPEKSHKQGKILFEKFLREN